jgi:hypothetical protein
MPEIIRYRPALPRAKDVRSSRNPVATRHCGDAADGPPAEGVRVLPGVAFPVDGAPESAARAEHLVAILEAPRH